MPSPRISRITKLYGRALIATAKRRERHGLDPFGMVELFATNDPTRNKSFTQWMVLAYIRESFLLEDLPKVRETLEIFLRIRSRLPVDGRDIGTYRSTDDLWTAVKGFAEIVAEDVTPSGRELRRRDRDKARAESIILYEGDHGAVVVPMTLFASCWWGRGTRWCTAGAENNAFDSYNRDAPLIVIVLPDGSKYQVWSEPDSETQIMDAGDVRIQEHVIDENWSIFGPILYWLLERNGDVLRFLPNSALDRDTCLMAVRTNGKALQWVPAPLRDEEICRTAVENNGDAIHWVRKEFKTADMCLAAAKNARNDMLYLIPEDLRSREICQAAVEGNGINLQWVPAEFIDREICIHALETNWVAVPRVPRHLMDREMCLVAVRTFGSCVVHMLPQELVDREICLAALEETGTAIAQIPRKFVDRETCLAAARREWFALPHIPMEFRDREVCLAACRQDLDALRHVPDDLKAEIEEACRNERPRSGEGDSGASSISRLWDETELDPLAAALDASHRVTPRKFA